MKRAETEAIARSWRNPQFSNIGELEDRVAGMEDAEFASVEVRGQTVPRFAIVGKTSGQFFGTCTDKYRIVQNREAFAGLVKVLKDADVPVSGSIVSPAVGQSHIVLVIDDPMEGPDSPYRFVIEAVNSYNGAVSWGGWSSLLRAICGNGMLSIKGVTVEMSHRHVMQPEKAAEMWQSFITEAAGRVKNSYAIIEAAQLEPVRNLEAMYRGAGFGVSLTAWMIEDFDKRVPESVGRPLTKLDAYNNATNFISNRTKGNYHTNMDLLAQASKILETAADTLEITGLGQLTIASATP